MNNSTKELLGFFLFSPTSRDPSKFRLLARLSVLIPTNVWGKQKREGKQEKEPS